MGRTAKSIELTNAQRAELEHGYKMGSSVFSRRCHMILLKSKGKISADVADIIGTNQVSVNNWLKRYEQEGISGLKTKPGQGRKPIFDEQADEQKVKAAVKNERQRLKHAKADLEEQLGKKFSMKTLKRFLKNLSANGNGYA